MNILKQIKEELSRTIWNVGLIEGDLSTIIDNQNPFKVHWMNHSIKKSWFADPFILDVNDKYIVILVEEFYYPINRGRISKLTISRDGFRLVKSEVILELDTHLSFPIIRRIEDKIYIYPENSQSGQLNLYEFNPVTNKCSFIKTLCNKPLTDAVMVKIKGEEYIFATRLPNPNSNELEKYSGSHLLETYYFDSKIGRNAGDWFTYNGSMYRPAQDCNVTYGGALLLQKVIINGDQISFETIKRIVSQHPILKKGCHTFNHYKGFSIIDVKGPKHPYVMSLYNTILKLWKK